MTNEQHGPERYKDYSKAKLLQTINTLEENLKSCEKEQKRNKDYTPEQMIDMVTDNDLFQALYRANMTNVADVAYELRLRGLPTESENFEEKRYLTLLKDRLDRFCREGKASSMKINLWERSPFRVNAYCLYTGVTDD